MAKQQFTPGPWEAVCVGSGGVFSNPVDVYEVHAGGGQRRVAEALFEGDAHLIAAAPDMLVALNRVIGELVYAAEKLPHSNAKEALTVVRAAIAKASGKAEGRG